MKIKDDFDKNSIILDNYKELPKFHIYKEQEFGNKSMEVYFGRNAPLAVILVSYCEKLKDLLGDPNIKYDFKDKKFVSKIKNLCDNFGKAIATEVNAESCAVQVSLDKEMNAYCVPIFTCFDNRPLDKNGKPIAGKVDLDKYVDLENIVQTKTGYKYKKAANKLLFININIGFIWKSTPEEMAACLCHELGHCFQQGIFGTYKNYSDLLYQNETKTYSIRMAIISSVISNISIFSIGLTTGISLPITIIAAVIAFFFFPIILNNPLVVKIKNAFTKFANGRIVDEKRWMMKDKLEKMDNGTLSDTERNQMNAQTKVENTNRKKIIDKELKSTYDSYKKINLYKKEKEVKQSLWKGLLAIFFDFNSRTMNFWKTVSLSRYAQNKTVQETFYKKYEFFADIFASSYGFGPTMYKNLIHMEKDYDNYLSDIYSHGIYKIPLARAAALYNMYDTLRDAYAMDEHGETYERASAMYTNLVNELKTNPDLTAAQKKALIEDCNMYKKLDDEYYNTMKKDGWLYKSYNKMLSKKITTVNPKVEELVLQPILEVAKETSGKK